MFTFSKKIGSDFAEGETTIFVLILFGLVCIIRNDPFFSAADFWLIFVLRKE